MKSIILISLFAVLLLAGCDNNYIDTGLADGDHDCSMYDYLLSDHSNWDSLVLVIQRADLVELVRIRSIRRLPCSESPTFRLKQAF